MAGVSKTVFLHALKAKIKSSKKAIKIKRVKSLYPWAIEKQYAKTILQWLRPLHELVVEYLSIQGESILKGDSMDSMHNDNIPGAGTRLFFSIASGWVGQFFPDKKNPPSNIMIGLGGFSESTKVYSSKQWEKQTKALLGFEFKGNDLWWNDLKPAWEERNYDLIKSVANDYIGRVNDITEKAVTHSWNYKQLTDEIKKLGPDVYKDSEGKKRPGFMEYKSRLIARDQIGKLNGLISQSEQEEIGLQMYEWDTAGDERVRGKSGGHFPKASPSHWAMQDKLCRWDNPEVYSIDGGATWIPRTADMPYEHPGMAIQCRCVALPYWRDIISDIEQEE